MSILNDMNQKDLCPGCGNKLGSTVINFITAPFSKALSGMQIRHRTDVRVLHSGIYYCGPCSSAFDSWHLRVRCSSCGRMVPMISAHKLSGSILCLSCCENAAEAAPEVPVQPVEAVTNTPPAEPAAAVRDTPAPQPKAPEPLAAETDDAVKAVSRALSKALSWYEFNSITIGPPEQKPEAAGIFRHRGLWFWYSCDENSELDLNGPYDDDGIVTAVQKILGKKCSFTDTAQKEVFLFNHFRTLQQVDDYLNEEIYR